MTEIKQDIVRDLMRVAYAWADEPVCPVSGRSGALEIAIRDALRAGKSQPVEQGEPARPMSDEKISAGFIEPIQVQLLTAYEMWVTAVRWTEEQHGIKGATE